MDVLITIGQFLAAILIMVGVAFVEDTGVQLILSGVFMLTILVLVEARRSA